MFVRGSISRTGQNMWKLQKNLHPVVTGCWQKKAEKTKGSALEMQLSGSCHRAVPRKHLKTQKSLRQLLSRVSHRCRSGSICPPTRLCSLWRIYRALHPKSTSGNPNRATGSKKILILFRCSAGRDGARAASVSQPLGSPLVGNSNIIYCPVCSDRP